MDWDLLILQLTRSTNFSKESSKQSLNSCLMNQSNPLYNANFDILEAIASTLTQMPINSIEKYNDWDNMRMATAISISSEKSLLQSAMH